MITSARRAPIVLFARGAHLLGKPIADEYLKLVQTEIDWRVDGKAGGRGRGLTAGGGLYEEVCLHNIGPVRFLDWPQQQQQQQLTQPGGRGG